MIALSCRLLRCLPVLSALAAAVVAVLAPEPGRGAELAQEPVAPVYRPFRIVSYNVMLGLGYRLQMELGTVHGPGLARSLAAHKALRQPQVLGLQEVCVSAGPQLTYLIEAMRKAHGGAKIYSAYATDGRELDLNCSNAQVTLSPYPILASGRFEFPLLSWRNAALWTDLDITGVAAHWNQDNRIRIYNLHLINRVGSTMQVEGARWTQVQALLTHYRQFQAAHPQTPVVWLGDFNSLGNLLHPWRQELAIRKLSELFIPSLRVYRPTHALLQQVDWIFADRLTPLQSRVVFLPYSDHFPVVADY